LCLTFSVVFPVNLLPSNKEMKNVVFLTLLSLWSAIAAKQALRNENNDLPLKLKAKFVAPADTGSTVAAVASWTYYAAYPDCCPGLPNYDPNAPTTECQYNRCNQPGYFYAIGQRDSNFVQNTNLVSLWDGNDPSGKSFYSKYADRYVTVTGTCGSTTATFTALVADTCSDDLCDNCCSKTADPNSGFLISMEYWTMMRNFGTTTCGVATNTVTFSIDTSQSLAIPNCGANDGGACQAAQTCCGADNFCNYGLDACGTGCQSGYGSCAGPYSCGLINGANCTNSGARCCSQYGYCANSNDACGSGCQGSYGYCNSDSNASNDVSARFSFAIALAFLPLFNFIFNMLK